MDVRCLVLPEVLELHNLLKKENVMFNRIFASGITEVVFSWSCRMCAGSEEFGEVAFAHSGSDAALVSCTGLARPWICSSIPGWLQGMSEQTPGNSPWVVADVSALASSAPENGLSWACSFLFVDIASVSAAGFQPNAFRAFRAGEWVWLNVLKWRLWVRAPDFMAWLNLLGS